MKRLVTICFVMAFLAVVPAGATLQMSVTGGYQNPEAPKTVGLIMGETAQIVLSSDTSAFSGWLNKDDGIGSLYPIAQPPIIALIAPEIGFGQWYQIGTSSPVEPGTQFVFNFVYDSVGEAGVPYSNVTLYDEDGATALDSYYFYDVPEPATIGLLALGGVLLRKRK